MEANYVGLDGIEFVEFSSLEPEKLSSLFQSFGFSKTMDHKSLNVECYRQGQINILLNKQEGTFAAKFNSNHGPCIPSMGWKVKDPEFAIKAAVERGAVRAEGDYKDSHGEMIPAIKGIGESLIYFIKSDLDKVMLKEIGFVDSLKPILAESKGFTVIDHLTNNVPKGAMEEWTNFYKNIFGFTQVRYFDIRGAKTGLTSFALRSPCGNFCIPINEGTEEGSQINEYLREYKGSGVQHIAFLTDDIVSSVQGLQNSPIDTLDIDDEYYDSVFDRVPNVSENHKKLQDLNILIDGDDEGYLLQIFTKNVVGPIFIEIIQRKNHLSFGEGNFGALFRSIERDQEKRGVLS